MEEPRIKTAAEIRKALNEYLDKHNTNIKPMKDPFIESIANVLIDNGAHKLSKKTIKNLRKRLIKIRDLIYKITDDIEYDIISDDLYIPSNNETFNDLLNDIIKEQENYNIENMYHNIEYSLEDFHTYEDGSNCYFKAKYWKIIKNMYEERYGLNR